MYAYINRRGPECLYQKSGTGELPVPLSHVSYLPLRPLQKLKGDLY